jgi:N-dimethylarginine dimethylaminohydrolase
MATNKYVFPYVSFRIKDRSKIRFWEDKWLGNVTIHEQYSALYNIVHHNGNTITKLLESSPPNVTFIRDLVGPLLAS